MAEQKEGTDLVSLLDVSINPDKKIKDKSRYDLHSILSEFKDKVGEKRYRRLEEESVKNPSQFKYVFGMYYSAASDYMKKYAVKGFNQSAYYFGTAYSALRTFEKDLLKNGYNIYNSVWFNSKDSFTKMHLLNYLDKTEVKYLKKNGLYQKESEIIYPFWIAMNAVAILPLAKEGLITPREYAAFLVGLGDMFFVINMMILSALWRGAHIKNKMMKLLNYNTNSEKE
ncbi:hypothetical protein M1112_00275 [Candidatus Parvarchaeota archaeon]|nr:hypothetical protein [Candidatus Parvarchaeota archaeon]